MKYYLLNFPRPIGVEPCVYIHRPEIVPVVVEVEPGHVEVDPYTDPEILEFDSIKEAIQHIVDFNGSDEYLVNIKVSDYKPGARATVDDYFKDMQDFLVNLP